MATRFGLFALCILISAPIRKEIFPELVVWNVGQGLWTTIEDDRGCWHFDFGGEFAPWAKVMAACRHRRNFLSLSHWDWDHMGFVRQIPYRLPDVCRFNIPLGNGTSRKRRLLRKIKACRFQPPYRFWENHLSKTSNDRSRVITWRGVVFPGDSSRHEEKYWSVQLNGVAQARILVLGHHGSRTSTSKRLLQAMRSLQLGVASSRFQRYGHPSPETVQRLERDGVPVLTTEDWGNIHIRL